MIEVVPSNPFVSRRVRPGAIPYLFPTMGDVDGLISDLRAKQWIGQIVGPHGSGKSTLIESLVVPLRRGGRKVVRYGYTNMSCNKQGVGTLAMFARDGTDSTFFSRGDGVVWDRDTQVIVDGFERLSLYQRLEVYVHCLYQGAGLLVTSHRRTFALPVLYRTQGDLAIAWKIVEYLAADYAMNPISYQDVSQSFQDHRGNMRELFFSLYDLYETRLCQDGMP